MDVHVSDTVAIRIGESERTVVVTGPAGAARRRRGDPAP
jgi:hypothetical protein